MTISLEHAGYCGPVNGEVDFVHRTNLRGLVRLSREPFCLRSYDSFQASLREGIARVYARAGVAVPQSFSSCSVLCEPIGRGYCGDVGYGRITLVLKPDAVSHDMLIVNGDFQNIASGVQRGIRQPDDIRYLTGATTEDVIRHLREWREHGGVIDSYCEARLLRCIAPQDIQRIHAPTDCGEVTALVDQINGQL